MLVGLSSQQGRWAKTFLSGIVRWRLANFGAVPQQYTPFLSVLAACDADWGALVLHVPWNSLRCVPPSLPLRMYTENSQANWQEGMTDIEPDLAQDYSAAQI